MACPKFDEPEWARKERVAIEFGRCSLFMASILARHRFSASSCRGGWADSCPNPMRDMGPERGGKILRSSHKKY